MTEVEVIGELVAVDSVNKLVTKNNSTEESIADDLQGGNAQLVAELF
jgi:hypothetical protein